MKATTFVALLLILSLGLGSFSTGSWRGFVDPAVAEAQVRKVTCPSCKKQVPAGARCSLCGKPLAAKPPAKPPKRPPSKPPAKPPAKPVAKVTCRHCGKVVDAGQFCQECGELLAAPVVPKPVKTIPVEGTMALAWHKRGNVLVSGGSDGSVQFWTMPQGTKSFLQVGHESTVGKLVWSRNGERLLSASEDGTLKVWNLHTGDLLATMSKHDAEVKQAAWSPIGDEKVASISDDGTLRLWDPITGRQVQKIDIESVSALDWSPDGTIATGEANGVVVLRNQFTMIPKTVLGAVAEGEVPESGVYGVAYSPTGGMIAVGRYDDTVTVYDTSTGEVNVRFEVPSAGGSLAWAPEGRRLAIECSEEVAIWDVWAKKRMMVLPSFTLSLAWSPDGKLLATGEDNGIAFWAIPPDHLAVPGSGGERSR